MGKIPQFFRTTGQNIINTFSFSDVIAGSAIQEFNLGTTKQDTTKTFHLSVFPFYSSDIELQGATPHGTNAFTLEGTWSFDVNIGVPRQIQGEAIININSLMAFTNDAATHQGYAIFKVRKYTVAGSTVEIANAQSPTNSGYNSKLMLSSTVVIPKTAFAIGDKLRLTIELWCKNTHASNDGNVWLFADPKNATSTLMTSSDITQAFFNCPFIYNT